MQKLFHIIKIIHKSSNQGQVKFKIFKKFKKILEYEFLSTPVKYPWPRQKSEVPQ